MKLLTRWRTAAILVLFTGTSTFANDTIAALAAGGLVPIRSAAVRMLSEDLRISERRVEITYRFVNDSDEDVDAIVAFPLPLLDGGLIYNHSTGIPTADPANFVGFEVRADGRRVPTRMQVRAWKDTREVTTRLRKLGLPLSVLDAKAFKAAIQKLSTADRKQLEADHLIVVEERDVWAFWDTDIQFYWRQQFPAHKTVELKQSYQPVVGGFYWTPTPSEDLVEAQHYCASPTEMQTLRRWQGKKLPDGEVLAWGREIDYILTTGANWKGPIGKFHLTVDTSNPSDMLLSCIRLRRTAPTRYELEQTNFTPTQDLHFLVLTEREPQFPSWVP